MSVCTTATSFRELFCAEASARSRGVVVNGVILQEHSMREVRVYFDSIGNLHLDRLIGQVRGLADEFGRPGILAKKGQRNSRVHRQGYLRTLWPTRSLAIDYQDVVEEFWGDKVSTRRYVV